MLDTKQWNRIQLEGNQPAERWGHSAVSNDGIMYIWGGQQEGNYFNDLFIFNSSTCKLDGFSHTRIFSQQLTCRCSQFSA